MSFANHLIVFDDDEEFVADIEPIADSIGFEMEKIDNLDDLLTEVKSRNPLAVLTDLVMQDVDGVEVVRKLSEQKYRGKVCLFTDVADTKVVMTAYRLGLSHGLNMSEPMSKPVDNNVLTGLLQSLWVKNYSISRADLEDAIELGDLVPYYQPKVQFNTEDGTTPIIEVEALVRWNHPDLGIVSPGLFIPLAEQTDLIVDLTDSVTQQALTQVSQWQNDGLDLSVGVNFSLSNLTDLSLPDKLTSACTDVGVDTSKLIIEITETAAMGNSLELPDILTRLRLKGFELAMDDFGTGYSSLTQLYRMPFSELKIDQSFLMDSDESEEARIIVRSIQSLADNLGLSSCAEGVETFTSTEFCREVGCAKLQGYFVSKPLPAPEITRFVDHWDPDLGLIGATG